MQETKTIINGKEVLIRKIPLKKYADLIAAFEELPKYFKDLAGKTNPEVLQMLPMLVKNCYPDIERVLMVATGMSQEDIDQIGLDDAIVIVQALLETNNFAFILETIKKVKTRPEMQSEQIKQTFNQLQNGSGDTSTK